MKKLIVSFSTLLIICTASINAYSVSPNETIIEFLMNDDVIKTEVNAENLPDVIKTALTGDTFTSWTFVIAHEVVNGDKKHYEVELTNGGENVIVNFDEAGNIFHE